MGKRDITGDYHERNMCCFAVLAVTLYNYHSKLKHFLAHLERIKMLWMFLGVGM